MYFIGKLKLDVSTQDNINAAFFKYSHLSNKRDIMLTDFGKFHSAQN